MAVWGVSHPRNIKLLLRLSLRNNNKRSGYLLWKPHRSSMLRRQLSHRRPAPSNVFPITRCISRLYPMELRRLQVMPQLSGIRLLQILVMCQESSLRVLIRPECRVMIGAMVVDNSLPTSSPRCHVATGGYRLSQRSRSRPLLLRARRLPSWLNWLRKRQRHSAIDALPATRRQRSLASKLLL